MPFHILWGLGEKKFHEKDHFLLFLWLQTIPPVKVKTEEKELISHEKLSMNLIINQFRPQMY